MEFRSFRFSVYMSVPVSRRLALLLPVGYVNKFYVPSSGLIL